MKSHRVGAGRILSIAASGALAVLGAGCGSTTTTTSPTATTPATTTPTATTPTTTTTPAGQLTVLAAASLSKTLPKIDASPRYTFGGSGALETEIQQGQQADVFLAASPKQPAALYASKLVYKPVEFATNTLVMIVPTDNPARIKSVTDITRKGVKIVVCNQTVPCGDYATTAFTNLGISAAATKNIVSKETDVTQVVAQIASGQGDVGFVYITDATAAQGKVRAISLPANAKPGSKDFIAVVKATKNLTAANAFLKLVLSTRGQATLRAAGFGKP